MGLHDYHLPDMDLIGDTAKDYYNNHLRGGEAHMEVGKLILNVAKKKATITVSVKPFGCMPSSGVSDGVQSFVTEKFPEAIFCPIEASGDGAGQCLLSRADDAVQSASGGQGGIRADTQEAGITASEVREYLSKKWWKGSSLYYPKHGTVAARSVELAQALAPEITKTRTARILDFRKARIRRPAWPTPIEKLRAI